MAFKWTSYASQVITGGIASLAIDAWEQSTEINNTSGLDLFVDLKIDMVSAVTAGAGNPNIPLYLLPSSDGSDYPSPPATAAGAVPVDYHVGSIAANAAASFTRGWVRGIVIPPGRFKFSVQNKLGVAFPAGVVLSAYVYSEQSV